VAVQPDHVHWWVRVWPSDRAADGVAADGVKQCKGRTSWHLRQEFPDLLTLPSRCTRASLASTADTVSPETSQRYLAAQARLSGRVSWRRGRVCPPYAQPSRRSCGRHPPRSASWRRSWGGALPHPLPHGPRAAQRTTRWKQRGISLTRSQQDAELKSLRAEMPEYGALHSHVLQDVLARLEKTYQAFFHRVQHGEKPGFPRFHGKDRYHSFTYKAYDNGARLDNGSLVLSTIGRIAVRWSRSLEGTIKTVTISKEAGGWLVCVLRVCRGAD